MSPFQVNQEYIFTATELSRPRMVVEKEKLQSRFPGFQFYGSAGKVSSVQGYITTYAENRYFVRIEIPDDYPYSLPDILLPEITIDPDVRHKYANNKICVMTSSQWNAVLSIAFLVAKTAIWLNKYDVWKNNGHVWPGTEQHH